MLRDDFAMRLFVGTGRHAPQGINPSGSSKEIVLRHLPAYSTRGARCFRCARMLWITSESVTSAITRSVPPHKGQTEISISNTRFKRSAEHPAKARRLGRSRFRRIRRDWSKVRRVIMTRAVYTKCRTHADVAQRLLETEDVRIVENSQYDYFWGFGRDLRGHNTYGHVLMDVRNKLREERQQHPIR